MSEVQQSAWADIQTSTALAARGRSIQWPRRPLIAGIVNLNDDSFSGDGTLDVDAALAQALRMVCEGADVIDVGGESARPNRPPVSEAEEVRRVTPFVERFHEVTQAAQPRDDAQLFPPLLSINTWRPKCARALLAVGGDLLNDMGALPDDSNARICAEFGAALLIMHSVGEPKVAHRHVTYANVIAELAGFFEAKMRLARDAGLFENAIVLDPGIDFAKPYADNLRIMRELAAFKSLGRPMLLPVSRKRVISEALGGRSAPERDAGTIGLIVGCALRGASILRVHNVAMTWSSLKIAEAVLSGKLDERLPAV